MRTYEFKIHDDKIARILGSVVPVEAGEIDGIHVLNTAGAQDELVRQIQRGWQYGRGHGPFPLDREIRAASTLLTIIDREPQQPLAFI